MSTKPTFRKSSLGNKHPAAPAAVQEPPAENAAPSEPAASQQQPTEAQSSTQRKKKPATKQQRWEIPAGMVRLGIYMHAPLYNDAKSAFIASQDLDAHPARTIAEWIAKVIEEHNERSSSERATIAEQLGAEKNRAGSANNRTFVVSEETVKSAQEAIAEDRRASHRVLSRSEYATEAIRWAIEQARKASGGQLPPAPARLPNGMS